MKKIFLAIAMFAGMFTSAMAQDSAETKDSVYVVKGDSVVAAYEVGSQIDYVTFKRPEAAKEWKTVVANAYFYWGNDTIGLPTAYSDIEQYGDENKFRIKNFLGSGIDYGFKIQTAEESLYYSAYTNLEGDVSTWTGSIEFDENNTYTYDGWDYFMPDMANEVYGWTVEGATVNYASFATYPGYSYIDFSQKYISTWAYGYSSDNRDVSGYFYGYWTE